MANRRIDHPQWAHVVVGGDECDEEIKTKLHECAANTMCQCHTATVSDVFRFMHGVMFGLLCWGMKQVTFMPPTRHFNQYILSDFMMGRTIGSKLILTQVWGMVSDWCEYLISLCHHGAMGSEEFMVMGLVSIILERTPCAQMCIMYELITVVLNKKSCELNISGPKSTLFLNGYDYDILTTELNTWKAPFYPTVKGVKVDMHKCVADVLESLMAIWTVVKSITKDHPQVNPYYGSYDSKMCSGCMGLCVGSVMIPSVVCSHDSKWTCGICVTKGFTFHNALVCAFTHARKAFYQCVLCLDTKESRRKGNVSRTAAGFVGHVYDNPTSIYHHVHRCHSTNQIATYHIEGTAKSVLINWKYKIIRIGIHHNSFVQNSNHFVYDCTADENASFWDTIV